MGLPYARLKVIQLAIVACCFWFPAASPASGDSWTKVAEEIGRAINSALKTCQNGNGAEAAEAVADAYFGIFEGDNANMEIAVRRFISLKKATEIEKNFADLRRLLSQGGCSPETGRLAVNLVKVLKESALTLEKKGVGVNSR